MAEGRVRVNGRVVRERSARVDPVRDVLAVDDERVAGEREMTARRVYLMLNKPRGLVTTRDDPQGRETVYECLRTPDGAALPHVVPVGRLDKASEGLLLFTNDTRWAANVLDPDAHVDKVYHVQAGAVADEALLRRLEAGVDDADTGERLAVKRARLLRHGTRNSWLEVVLDEGRNRQIRRILDALGIEVLRLVRIAVGPLTLGDLAKGAWRQLTPEEVSAVGKQGSGKAKRRRHEEPGSR